MADAGKPEPGLREWVTLVSREALVLLGTIWFFISLVQESSKGVFNTCLYSGSEGA